MTIRSSLYVESFGNIEEANMVSMQFRIEYRNRLIINILTLKVELKL